MWEGAVAVKILHEYINFFQITKLVSECSSCIREFGNDAEVEAVTIWTVVRWLKSRSEVRGFEESLVFLVISPPRRPRSGPCRIGVPGRGGEPFWKHAVEGCKQSGKCRADEFDSVYLPRRWLS